MSLIIVSISGRFRAAFVPKVPKNDPQSEVISQFETKSNPVLLNGGLGVEAGGGDEVRVVQQIIDTGGSIEIFDAVGGGAEFVARIPLAENPVHGVTA